MRYIVLDLEWNQPYAPKYMIRKPVKLTGEIVQIGAVKLDEEFQIVDTFKIMVQPKYYTKMHSKVAKLTHIYTDDLQYGFPLEQALTHFKKWCGADFAFITWGWDDIGMLEDNMALHELDSSWLPKAYNLQPIYNNQISKEERQASLCEAMERLELTAAEAHDALNDARNAAQICRFLDMALGLEMYDTFKKPKRQSDDEVASASSRKSYRTRIEAMRAIELTSFVCNECGETVKKVSTMRDAIGDLPSLDPDVTDITEEERKKLFPDYEKKRLEGLAISKWHYPPRHKIRHVIAMMHTPEGCTAWDNEVYYPTLADGTKSKGYRNTYKRQWWDKPAYTVTKYTSRLGSQENGHPGMNLTGFDDEERRIYSDARVLSIFELMRVSSLPDDWNIPSWASSNLIREILGEGVPPRLMESAIIALENEINEQN